MSTRCFLSSARFSGSVKQDESMGMYIGVLLSVTVADIAFVVVVVLS